MWRRIPSDAQPPLTPLQGGALEGGPAGEAANSAEAEGSAGEASPFLYASMAT